MMEAKGLDRDTFKPLYVQLAERITEYIQKANLKPGDLIPSQNELIERFEVSQITVRIAFQRLISEGVINSIRGKGTFVAEQRIEERIEDVKSMEERMLSEGFIVENRCIEIIDAFPSSRIRKDLKLSTNAQTVKIRRLKYIEGHLIGIETRHFPKHLADQFGLDELGSQPFVRLLSRQTDSKVTRIAYHTKAGIILELEANLMNVSIDTPVLIQYSVMFDSKNNPLIAGRITYLADKIELNFEVSENAGSSIKYQLK